MSTKRVYKCQTTALARSIFCGKEKASASCLEASILGGKCANLAVSSAKEPKPRALKKVETKSGESRETHASLTRMEKPEEKVVKGGLSTRDALDVISSVQFVPQPKEKGYEAQLYTAFRTAGFPVEYESQRRGARFDLVLGRDEIAVELKVVKNVSVFDPLFGQIDRYCDQFKKVIVVLIDLFRNPSIMNKEIARLKRISPENIEVIVK